ncbi:hypothetical protein, partial [Plasmodium yoelii yoelii]
LLNNILPVYMYRYIILTLFYLSYYL